MAHFSIVKPAVEIDGHEACEVEKILVVANDKILDANGEEQESLGQAFLGSLGIAVSAQCVQTSYHGNFRGSYASVGGYYIPDLDKFIPPRPSDEATLDETGAWNDPGAEEEEPLL